MIGSLAALCQSLASFSIFSRYPAYYWRRSEHLIGVSEAFARHILQRLLRRSIQIRRLELLWNQRTRTNHVDVRSVPYHFYRFK